MTAPLPPRPAAPGNVPRCGCCRGKRSIVARTTNGLVFLCPTCDRGHRG